MSLYRKVALPSNFSPRRTGEVQSFSDQDPLNIWHYCSSTVRWDLMKGSPQIIFGFPVSEAWTVWCREMLDLRPSVYEEFDFLQGVTSQSQFKFYLFHWVSAAQQTHINTWMLIQFWAVDYPYPMELFSLLQFSLNQTCHPVYIEGVPQAPYVDHIQTCHLYWFCVRS